MVDADVGGGRRGLGHLGADRDRGRFGAGLEEHARPPIARRGGVHGVALADRIHRQQLHAGRSPGAETEGDSLPAQGGAVVGGGRGRDHDARRGERVPRARPDDRDSSHWPAHRQAEGDIAGPGRGGDLDVGRRRRPRLDDRRSDALRIALGGLRGQPDIGRSARREPELDLAPGDVLPDLLALSRPGEHHAQIGSVTDEQLARGLAEDVEPDPVGVAATVVRRGTTGGAGTSEGRRERRGQQASEEMLG